MKPHLVLGLVLTFLTHVLTSELSEVSEVGIGPKLSQLLEEPQVLPEEDLLEADASLLRNIFSVNRKRPKLKLASKRTQKKRLEGLFLALTDPFHCKYLIFLHSMEKKSTKVDFSPISCKKAPFYTRNGHF